MAKTIYISYFLNPYCFYFKFDDDLHNEDLQCLEDKISKYARDEMRQNNDEKASIAVGDTVAAYVVPWGKWVRSIIVRCDLNRSKCYELWAIDHGKKFRTAYRNVVKLPEDLANESVIGVHRGSLHGISPAKLEFNLNTCLSELQSIENWSGKATHQCMELLTSENVIKTTFEIKAQYEKCYFGDLCIETALSKKRLNIANALKQIDEAVDIDFAPELDQIEEKYRKCHLKDLKHISKFNDHSDSMNVSSVRKSLHAIQSPCRSSDTHSVVQSTIVPSEICNGATRMNRRLRIAAPSIAPSNTQSTIVPSEINGGVTQMQKKKGLTIAPPSEISNGITQTNRPNRNFKTNLAHTNGKNVRRQVAPMPAGHEPDMENFRKYNS